MAYTSQKKEAPPSVDVDRARKKALAERPERNHAATAMKLRRLR